MSRENNNYTTEDRRKAFQTWMKTECLRATSRIMGIPLSTLSLWQEKYNWKNEKERSLDLVKNSIENNLQAINNLLFGEMGKTSFELISGLGFEGLKDSSISMLDGAKIHMDQVMTLQILKRKLAQAIKKYKPRNFKEMLQLADFVTKQEDKLLSFVSKQNEEQEEDIGIDKNNVITIEDMMKKKEEE